MSAAASLHASCIVIGEAGILIRGSSGSGKSTLARELILDAERSKRFARLVSDDRVRVENRNGRLLARGLPALAGRLEARGLGILTLPYESSAIVRLVIDCETADPPRLPTPEEGSTCLCGVVLPRLAVRLGPGLAGLVLLRLGAPAVPR
jgi:serine kinase of HPr protein (carbohydrate metabolism regulator)